MALASDPRLGKERRASWAYCPGSLAYQASSRPARDSVSKYKKADTHGLTPQLTRGLHTCDAHTYENTRQQNAEPPNTQTIKEIEVSTPNLQYILYVSRQLTELSACGASSIEPG